MVRGLLAGNGLAFIRFLSNPDPSALTASVYSNKVENQGCLERSAYFARLSVLSEVEVNLDPELQIPFGSNLSKKFNSSFVKQVPLFLFVLFRALFGKKKDRLYVRSGLLSENAHYRLTWLLSFAELSLWKNPIPLWVLSLIKEYERKWGRGSFESSYVMDKQLQSTVIATWAGDEIIKAGLTYVSLTDATYECCNSSGSFHEISIALDKEQAFESLKKGTARFPLCLLSSCDVSTEDNLEETILRGLDFFSFCPKKARISGLLLGKIGSNLLYKEWLSIDKRWPVVSFPDETMIGFLNGSPIDVVKTICENVRLVYGDLGHVLTLFKLDLYNDGLLSGLNIGKLFMEISKAKNSLAENALANHLSSQKMWTGVPLKIIGTIYKEALFLRVRYQAFIHCYKSFKTKNLIPCLFDACNQIKELAFEEIISRGDYDGFQDSFLKVTKDPMVSLEFRKKVSLYI